MMNQLELFAVIIIVFLVALPALGGRRRPEKYNPDGLYNYPWLALPRLTCPSSCPTTTKPVCGTDGATYMNECLMQQAACETGISITRRFYGWCLVSNLTKDCPKSCSGVQMNPVCDTNGYAYDNLCELKLARCGVPGTEVYHKFSSKCNMNGQFCDNSDESNASESCKDDDLFPGPPCPFGCQTTKRRRGMHNKPLEPPGDRAVSVQNCPTQCPPTEEYICATDNISYVNECLMQQASCETGIPITKRFKGVCPSQERAKDCPTYCSGLQKHIVCDTQITFHDNLCKLKLARCGMAGTEVYHKFSSICYILGNYYE